MDRTCLRVLVRGRVQGVGYRYYALHCAQAAGVAGWVRNRSDGAVEAQLEGASAAVEQVLEQLRRGPSSAHVDALEVATATPENAQGFEIRRGGAPS